MQNLHPITRVKDPNETSRFKYIDLSDIKYLRDVPISSNVDRYQELKSHFNVNLDLHGDKNFLNIIAELIFCIELKNTDQLKQIISALNVTEQKLLNDKTSSNYAMIATKKVNQICNIILLNIEQIIISKEIKQDLIATINSYSNYISNKCILKELCSNIVEIKKNNIYSRNSYTGFNFQKWAQYFQLDPYRINDKKISTNLFGLLSSQEEDIKFLRVHRQTNTEDTTFIPENVIKEIATECKAILTEKFSINLANVELIQVLSTGRSGTSFLRKLIVDFSTKFTAIHDIYNIPNLEARSAFQDILNQISDGKGYENYKYSINEKCFKKYIIFHIILFCSEIISHANQHKPAAILNHWWVPFSPVFAEIFPKIKFIMLCREKEQLLFSLIKKQQILSNPMPIQLIGRDISSMEDVDLRIWSEYHISNVEKISKILSQKGHKLKTITLTPPDQISAQVAVQLFSLSCEAEKIILSPKDNQK